MKKSLLETSNRIYGIIIGLLGFSLGCQSCGQQADMYGSPTAEHIVTGRVTDTKNNPIPGIEIELKSKYTEEHTFTDEKGDFSFNDRHGSLDISYELIYRDLDGEKNGGEFENMMQGIEFKKEEFSGGDGSWYHGKATKTVHAVLTQKEPQAE